MQKLSENHGPNLVQHALRFLALRLGARPETQAIAAEIQAARKDVATTQEAFEQAREVRIAATAEISYRDGKIDHAVRNLAREALVLTAGRADDPRARRLFPMPPSVAMKGIADETQSRFVRGIIETLKSDPGLASLKPHIATLTTLLSELDQAVARREELYIPESQAQTALRIALDRARRAYNQCLPQLQLIFPSDPALVDSCFATLRARASRQDPAAEDPDTTADPVS